MKGTSEIDIQCGRIALLKEFEKVTNLPLQDFACLTHKSHKQLLYDLQSCKLLALGIGSLDLKVPNWQLDSVKLQLTQSVMKSASDVESWTLYFALSRPLERLAWRSPIEVVTADTIDEITEHVLNFLSFMREGIGSDEHPL